ncbi:MAG: hypothetical protein LBD91_06355 [Prevotellaceae bacterium]|nr:hypothetical protein [Prevotellaceae bacterium]
MSRTQPIRDAEYIAWARNIKNRCVAQMEEWDLYPAQVARLTTLFDSADAAYEASLNPETANRHTVSIKQVAFSDLRVFFNTYINVLVANENISESDLRGMGLPSRAHHFYEPLPVPGDVPEVGAVVGQHHDINVYVAIPQHGQPSEFLTRKGYYGFVLRYRKDGDTEWREEHSTRLHITLLFEHEDEGKRLTLTAAWINPRIQHGPWSDEISVLN